MTGDLPLGVTQAAIDAAIEYADPTPLQQELDAAEAAEVEITICDECYEYVNLSNAHGRRYVLGHSRALCWDCLLRVVRLMLP